MKAVILAGGRGERLRPITDTRPKPLVPVLARPVMDYCLSLLAHHGVTRAFVTTHYLADQIRHRYGQSAFGMTLSYAREESPMGTAGGVKLLEENLREEEFFLVMSGDALCDFDLTAAVNFHKEKKADVTIVLSSVKTPLEYGVVLSDTFEKIFAFSEKPDWCETFSDMVNTGVYILSPKVLKKIPSGKTFDFSHDLFPLLLKEGYRLFGYKDEGYWCDIGKIPTLYRCNLDLLSGRAKTYLPADGRKIKSADGDGYYFVSDGARVDEGAVVRSGTVISPGAHLAEGAGARGSLILENVKLEKGAIAREAVLCENTVLREDAIALPGSVLGAGSEVARSAEAERGRKYPPESFISPFDPFREEGLIFTEKGASSGPREGLESADAEKLGYAFSRAFERNIAVVWDERNKGSAYFASIFAAGVVSGGKDALLLGEGCIEMASFGAALFRSPCVFVSVHDGRGVFLGFEEDGLPLVRKDVLRLSRFHGEEKCPEQGKIQTRDSLREKYIRALSDVMGDGEGKVIGIRGSAGGLLKKAAILSRFRAYDGTREEEMNFEIFDRGFKFFSKGEKIADTEKARLYLIEKELGEGRREFCLPRSAPALFSEHIRNRGGTVKYFSMEQTTRTEKEERAKAEKERWLYDNHFLCARLIHCLKNKNSEEIKKEFASTPDIFISRIRYVPQEEHQAKLVGMARGRALPFAEKQTVERVRMVPGFYGIRIISEALSFEAALDNAFECRGKLNEIEKDIRGR